ncbi:hypothetical protein AAMO2058_001526400 [Amorphochlora amoebiformis]
MINPEPNPNPKPYPNPEEDGKGEGGKGGGEMPERFVQFLEKNGIAVSRYSKVIEVPRFVRIPIIRPLQNTIQEVEKEMETKLVRTCLPRIFHLKHHGSISGYACYKSGSIFGIDLASALAVAALDLHKGLHVLDLCCAPGAKLCMIAEVVADQTSSRKNEFSANSEKVRRNSMKISDSESFGSVTGVDIGRERLNTCRNLMRKYKIMGARLFHEDGTKFFHPPPSTPILHNRILTLGDTQNIPMNFKKRGKKKRKRATWTSESEGASTLTAIDDNKGSEGLYARVLVDAECTHDGSIKHMNKYIKNGWKGFHQKVLGEERMSSLRDLQCSLIQNGFKNLAQGGILVYSTCSFCRCQNEDIIDWLLAKNPNAKLLPPHPTSTPRDPREDKESCEEDGSCSTEHVKASKFLPKWGFRDNTVRFDPWNSGTSGLFLARITKIAQSESLPSRNQ